MSNKLQFAASLQDKRFSATSDVEQLSSRSHIISPRADWRSRLSVRCCKLGNAASSAALSRSSRCAHFAARRRRSVAAALPTSGFGAAALVRLLDLLQLRRPVSHFPLVSFARCGERLIGDSPWRLQDIPDILALIRASGSRHSSRCSPVAGQELVFAFLLFLFEVLLAKKFLPAMVFSAR